MILFIYIYIYECVFGDAKYDITTYKSYYKTLEKIQQWVISLGGEASMSYSAAQGCIKFKGTF